ncbi:MAG: S8 family peptidase [Agathobacter sp.]|nr:S8 family peptidase [Agathobacter sp.]
MSNSFNLKFENNLTAAFNASPKELSKSFELSEGFNPVTDTWDVIVKYTGNLKMDLLSSMNFNTSSIKVTELFNGYAIVSGTKDEISDLSSFPNILYIEKPKRLLYSLNQSVNEICLNNLSQQTVFSDSSLNGNKTLIAIIDSGIDYSHPDFINEYGESRIVYLWDQTLTPDEQTKLPPKGYNIGVLFDNSTINKAINSPISLRYEICPSRDFSGHGTHVAGIAAGNGNASEGIYRGIAYEASLIIVKLGSSGENIFPNTAQLMEAVNFSIEKSIELKMPLTINLSYGNVYGSHTGTSLLENYLDSVSGLYRTAIVSGSGNEGVGNGHQSAVFSKEKVNESEKSFEFAVGNFESGTNIQIWKNYWDDISFKIQSPDFRIVAIPNIQGSYRFNLKNTLIYVTVGSPSPYSIYQEIYIDLISDDSYIDAGIWRIIANPVLIKDGNFQIWLPGNNSRQINTQFLIPDSDITLTLPGTSPKIITVGAYNSYNDTIASFSGRGYTWNTNYIKPELVAPGVNITSCAPGGSYLVQSGTSMAVPFVSGACSLLMQWGIVEGNDSYLYGEKIKAALISGTKPLPAISEYPNQVAGWGALCFEKTLDILKN